MKNAHIPADDDLYLSLLEEKDAITLFNLTDNNRTYLRKWMPWLDDTKTVADAKAFIIENRKEFNEKGCSGWGIFYENQLAGMIGLHKKNKFNDFSAEIGYWLSEALNGKGIIAKSCTVLIDKGFCEWELNRIEIRVAVENSKSKAIPKKLGFKKEGLLRKAEFLNDRFWDVAIYGMLKEDWCP